MKLKLLLKVYYDLFYNAHLFASDFFWKMIHPNFFEAPSLPFKFLFPFHF